MGQSILLDRKRRCQAEKEIIQPRPARHQVQLGSSSPAIHGGAYFSAVFRRKFNPTTVLRPCQPLAWYWRGFSPALCHFCFVFQKFAVLKAAFQEDFFKNGQNGFLTSVILHFFCVNPWLLLCTEVFSTFMS